MDAISSGDEDDDEHMSTDMLEDVRDSSQSHKNIIGREAGYKINV